MSGEHAIRAAGPTDAAEVRWLIERAIRMSAFDVYSPAQIEAWATGGSTEDVASMIEHTAAFVAEVDGRVVGFSNLISSDVDQLYVDPEFGGRGVARELYRAVEDEARRRGVERLTATASLRARPVFEAFGFREVARVQRSFNGQAFPVVEMAKDGLSARA
jgi:putative acetyltransferase